MFCPFCGGNHVELVDSESYKEKTGKEYNQPVLCVR